MADVLDDVARWKATRGASGWASVEESHLILSLYTEVERLRARLDEAEAVNAARSDTVEKLQTAHEAFRRRLMEALGGEEEPWVWDEARIQQEAERLRPFVERRSE